MKPVKRIALVFFPINDVGGIITWNKQIQKGFASLGIKTEYFYCTPKNTYPCDPENDQLKERYTMIAGAHLSYNSAHLKHTLAVLNSYDAIIFTKNSPHPTKDNLKHKDIENWKLLYSETKPPKVVVFHDALWQKTNVWAQDVAPYVSVCIAAQRKFIHSVKTYPADCLKYWDYFPVDFEPIDSKGLANATKQDFGMVATQWIGWKNHSKLLPKLPEITLPLYLFGAGIEWHYLKKTPEYQAGIGVDFKMGNDFNLESTSLAERMFAKRSYHIESMLQKAKVVHNPDSPHVMFGTVKYEVLQYWYSRALLSIDLSTRGYTNYTHFEPLCYRTLSFIERNVINDPDNVIPEDCCIPYDMADLAETINLFKGEADSAFVKQVQENGYKFSRYMDCVKVAERIVAALRAI